MTEFCDDEVTNKPLPQFGDVVETPLGLGKVCELDGETSEYCVYGKGGYLGWFTSDQLKKI